MNPPSATPRGPAATRPARVRRGAGRRSAPALAGVLAAFALLAGAATASAFTSDSAFRITGHGWGHGIGMSQWGAYGYAKHGWDFRAILKHYYTGIDFGDAPDHDVRVRLRSGLSAVKVGCPKAYTAAGGGGSLAIAGGVTATTTYANGAYRVTAAGQTQSFSSPVTFTAGAGTLTVLTATDLGDTGPYRGVIRVVRDGGKLMMINAVPLESYLRGVVPHEVPPSWPLEALKAQACAARAFALGSRKPDESWDVYCDVRSQAYVGVGIEDPSTDRAVKETAGVVPAYNGKPILAVYFSCSGGRTENIEDGWPGASPIAYLKSVADPYDTYASLHDWGPLRRTAAQVAGPLSVKGTLRAVYAVRRGESPRIVKAALIGSGGVTFIDGNALRMKLGLNSTWAEFVSMSMSPAARDAVTIAAGDGLTLKGRIYPALATGATVRLYFNDDGQWRSREVATTIGTEDLGSGYTARFSAYIEGISPETTTQYYFKWDKAVSPTTTVTVQ
jgi:stage II sporulation protein D